MLKSRSGGGERNEVGRIWKRWAKIPVKTFPIKKGINTELLIDRKWFTLYTKVKKGSDQEITDLLEEDKKRWQEITVEEVKTAAAC